MCFSLSGSTDCPRRQSLGCVSKEGTTAQATEVRGFPAFLECLHLLGSAATQADPVEPITPNSGSESA